MSPRISIPGTFPDVSRARHANVFNDEAWEQSSYGLLVPKRPKRRYKSPVAIDLFCGAGGFSLGFLQAGFQVVAALDNDPWATITYMYNLGAYPAQFHFASDGDKERLEKQLQKTFKQDENGAWRGLVSGGNRHPDWGSGVGNFFFGDVRRFTGQQILDAIGLEKGDVWCVAGGPPCQGFSRAGKRNVMDPRNSLVFEFARLVLEIEPKTMVMENVPDIVHMVTPDGVPVVDALCRILEDGGFGPYNALRKSLIQSAGVGTALRGRKVKTKPDYEDKEEEQGAKQMALFGEEG